MTDDIVTRLRMFSLDDGTDALNKLLGEAANEIERLRKALQDTFIEMEQLQKECDEWESLATRNGHP